MSRDTKRNISASIKTRLLQHSQQTGMDYMKVLVRYLHERLLYRISISKYKEQFLLKGSSLLYAYERWDARPTLDIDLMGRRISNNEEVMHQVIKEICVIQCPEDGVIFDENSLQLKPIAVEKKYPGVSIVVDAHIDTILQKVSIDVCFGDVVTPEPSQLDYPTILEGLPEVNIMAYNIETLMAEKFHAMVDRDEQNSRLKDFYDLYQLFTKQEFDEATLEDAIRNTFRNRETEYNNAIHLFQEAFATDPLRKMRWKAFLKKMKRGEDVPFEDVMQLLRERLKPYWNLDFFYEK